MQTTLPVQSRTVQGYTYYRLNIPTKISKELCLKAGDRLKVDFIGVVDSSEEESDNA